MEMKVFISIVAILLLFTLAVYYFWDEEPALSTNEEEKGVCILDSLLCPDGSYVGRIPPECNFAQCPTSSTTTSNVLNLMTPDGTTLISHSQVF